MFARGRHPQDVGKRIAVLLSDQTEGGLFCHNVATMTTKKKKSQAFAKVRFSYSFSLWYNGNN